MPLMAALFAVWQTLAKSESKTEPKTVRLKSVLCYCCVLDFSRVEKYAHATCPLVLVSECYQAHPTKLKAEVPTYVMQW